MKRADHDLLDDGFTLVLRRFSRFVDSPICRPPVEKFAFQFFGIFSVAKLRHEWLVAFTAEPTYPSWTSGARAATGREPKI